MEKGIEIKRSDDLDFSGHWNVLHDVISQGEKLREQKPRPKGPREYGVINIDFLKKSKKTHRKCPNRYFHHDTSYTKPLSMQNFHHRILYSKLSSYTEERKPKRIFKKKSKCPLRVMELAEPSKRQCLETLREKCHSLPDFMLDRLRRQLRDQKPVVQIKDAINCFKNKSSCKKRRKKQTKGETEPRSLTEMKYFCALFGTLIAKIINQSGRAEGLGDQIQRISKIVSDEINRIMVGCKTRKAAKDRFYNINLQDTARKVAIWIGLILEESAEKMLEEELRELEEEEGPVLDFLDDVLESVLIICAPHVPEDNTSSSSSDHFDEAFDKEMLEGETAKETTLKDISSEDTNIEKSTTKDADNVDIIIDSKTEDAIKDITIDLLAETANEPLTADIADEIISTLLQNAIQSESKNFHLMSLPNEDTIRDLEAVSDNTEIYTTEKPNLSQKVSETYFTQTKVKDDTEISIKEAKNKTAIEHDFTKNISIDAKLPVLDKDETTDQNDSKSYDWGANEIGASKSVIQDSKSQQDFIKKFLEITNDIENQELIDLGSNVEDQNNIGGDEKNESIHEPDKIVKFEENNEDHNEQRKTSTTKSREQILHAHKHTVRRLIARNIGATASIQSMSWTHSSDHMPPNVQPPNEHLLSQVDEKWPKHVLPYQSSHALDLVKKSVTSLGRIFEQEPFLGVHESRESDQIESFIGEFQWIHEEGQE